MSESDGEVKRRRVVARQTIRGREIGNNGAAAFPLPFSAFRWDRTRTCTAMVMLFRPGSGAWLCAGGNRSICRREKGQYSGESDRLTRKG
jgi:hypothetical protein